MLRALRVYPAVLLLLIFVAFPLYWMVVTSFKPQTEVFRTPPTFLPSFEVHVTSVSSPSAICSRTHGLGSVSCVHDARDASAASDATVYIDGGVVGS